MTEGYIAPKKKVPAKKTKTRQWSLEFVQTRNVADKLNELSAKGYTIFSVNPSVSIGGSYEVVYYIDRQKETDYETPK